MATAIAACVTLFACHLSGLSVSPDSANLLALYALVIAIALYLDPVPFGRVAVAADALILFLVISGLGAVASYVGMKQSGTLTDSLLDQADRAMGFSWTAIRAWVEQTPVLISVLTHAYNLCTPMPLLIVALLCATHRSDRCYRFLKLFAVALVVTLAVALFFPAIAAFAFYGYSPVPQNALHYGEIIAGLRDGSLTAIDLRNLGGILTFPSFHATMAILFAWALWPIRQARAAATIANGLMLVAAVPIGGHYGVDILGGSLIAVAAILFVGGTQGNAVAAPRVQPPAPIADQPAH
ncbi:phosphatase PAP2 family protein [Sphingomonas sp. ST-64]|uniref:Phosphatase PAP2 family protein n=1 Tax=Sphingomonas plantiphila TaxID=3163295 RepID=A0ABW8YPK4_9SPHN